jgi:hypothetical protein
MAAVYAYVICSAYRSGQLISVLNFDNPFRTFSHTYSAVVTFFLIYDKQVHDLFFLVCDSHPVAPMFLRAKQSENADQVFGLIGAHLLSGIAGCRRFAL